MYAGVENVINHKKKKLRKLVNLMLYKRDKRVQNIYNPDYKQTIK